MPRGVKVILENNLVEAALPGDDIQVSGVLMENWISAGAEEQRPFVEIFFYATHVLVLNKGSDFVKQNTDILSKDVNFFKQHWKTNDQLEAR